MKVLPWCPSTHGHPGGCKYGWEGCCEACEHYNEVAGDDEWQVYSGKPCKYFTTQADGLQNWKNCTLYSSVEGERRLSDWMMLAGRVPEAPRPPGRPKGGGVSDCDPAPGGKPWGCADRVCGGCCKEPAMEPAACDACVKDMCGTPG